MHAFLLIDSNPLEFVKKHKAKAILFSLQKIEDARELKKFVKFSFPEKTAIVIHNIDSATVEASNAFLKNLEEPTKNIIYILTATNLENVLPTIISRCEVVKEKSIAYKKPTSQIHFKDALNIKDREVAIKFVEDLVFIDHVKKEYKNMENYLYTLKNLKANGNVSLQMTNLVVRMNGHGR